MVDPATVDEQFEQIVRNSTSPATIPPHPITAELVARLLVVSSFTAAVLLFSIPPFVVALIAVALVALAAGEALVERRLPAVVPTVQVHV